MTSPEPLPRAPEGTAGDTSDTASDTALDAAPEGAPDPGLAPDVSIWSFSDRGPWVLDPDDIPWQWEIDRVRRGTRREVPQLLSHRHLPPLGRTARTLTAIGGALAGWLVFEWRRPSSRRGISHRLRKAFEHLGSSYVKLGQIVSGGEGLFPDELVAEFKLLRDQVPPEPFADVRAVVEVELGGSLEELFAWFDPEPIAAASIAQVHAARLPTGEQVVVKVQRPRVAQLFREDIAALTWIAPYLVGRIPVAALANPPALVELFAETVIEELDFRLEAQNMLDIAHVLALTNQRAMVVPRPHPHLVTKRVLVMERLGGFNWDDAVGMRAAGIDTEAVIRAGMVAFLEGAMLHGIFHGDLHGGNLFVLPDGRTALLDHGITGRLDDRKRQAFLKLMLAGTTNDVRLQMQALCELGALPADADIDAVIRDLKLDGPPKDPTQMTPDEMIGEIRDITKAMLAYGARMPKELMLFVKDLLFLDGALATLAPNLDLFATLTEVAMYFAAAHGDKIAGEIGLDPRAMAVDIGLYKATVGIADDRQSLTYAELQERRQLIAKRMEDHNRSGRRRTGALQLLRRSKQRAR